ncbi:MAG TPA: NUDIX hydrolase [Syntrophales bacterium]|nr:NUDIX hydrolase [Syntrophales bacterium]
MDESRFLSIRKDEPINPWKTLTSKNIYENEWIVLQEDKVVTPKGISNLYAKVKFKKKTVGIVALDEAKHLWLVGQYRYPIDQYSWEIPGGGASMHEGVLEAAKRELKEETGLSANKWQLIVHMYTCNSITDEEVFIFLAKELCHGKMELEETERIILKKIPLRCILEMVNNGLITDAVSIAGVFKTMINENVLNMV